MLPAADQAALRQAEAALMLWPKHVHAYGADALSLLPSVDRLVSDLRIIPLTAVFSHSAYVTVMDHVSGRLPLHDWEPVRQVGGSGWPLSGCMLGHQQGTSPFV